MPQKLELEGELPTRFILLGEDDEDDREMLKDIFTSLDKSLVLFFVNTGKELISALHKLGHQLPCLLVLDYNMPELNGADILKEIGSDPRYKDIPKVVWSTSGSDKFKNTCLELGAVDYIIKPSTTGELENIAILMLSYCKL